MSELFFRASPPAAPALALCCLALAWACAAPEAPSVEGEAEGRVQVRAGVDRATATLGDRVTYTLEVHRPADLEVAVPEPGAELGGLRVEERSVEPPRGAGSGGRVVERRGYTLVADRVGSYVIPPLAIRWDQGAAAGVAETPEVFVEVVSVLPADESELVDIRDVKPLRRLARRWLTLLATAGAVLFALALVAALWWWWRRRRAASVAPALAPHEVALLALERLRRTDFDDPEELRRHCFALSETVRVYVEARLGLNATDLTTEEILGRLAELPALSTADAERLRRLLTATDRVKWAAALPAAAEIEETLRTAVAFVESTRPQEPGDGAPAGTGVALAAAGGGG